MRERIYEELVSPVTVIESGEGAGGRLRFTALVSRADYVNANRRLYPAEELRRAFAKLNEDLGRGYGAVDHPTDGQCSVSDIGIRWLRFFEQGQEWYGEGEVIPTAKGRDLAAVIEAGIPIGFSTRGYADQEEVQHEGRTIRRMKNVELITVDAVTTPSVRDARIIGFHKEDKDVEELEQLRAELAAANEARATAEARVAELETALAEAEGRLTSAQEAHTSDLAQRDTRIAELEARLAEVENLAAENALTAKLNELVEGHRFAATIISEARELGVTLETAEKVVARLKVIVEAAAAAANTDEGIPRGRTDTDEDAETEETPRVTLTEAQIRDLRDSGLISEREMNEMLALLG